MMARCRLIVFESAPRWAVALRGALGKAGPRLVEVRSLAGAEAALVAAPHSLVAIEVTAVRLEAVVDFLQTIMTRYPHARAVALQATEDCSAELLLREAGAIDVLGSMLQARHLARLAARHAAQAPQEAIDVRELVREQMPWPAYATVSE
jgi:DNA-binding NtrC family response regulator